MKKVHAAVPLSLFILVLDCCSPLIQCKRAQLGGQLLIRPPLWSGFFW